MLDESYYGFHIWQNNDVVPVPDEDRAKIWYKRYRLWDSDSSIQKDLDKVKGMKNYRFAARMRAIPWTASDYPPDSVKPFYIKTKVNSDTIYIPKYYDAGFRKYYEDRVSHFKDLVAKSGVDVAFMDMDAMGRGGEAHTYQIDLTDAQQPNSEVRSWSLDLYIRLFGKDKIIVQTDRGDVVKEAYQKDVLGWRRDSLGRDTYIDGLKSQGIYDLLKSWDCYVIGELFGESGIDAQLAVKQAREMNVDTMGNGNYTKTYSQMNDSEKKLWLDFAHELKQRYVPEPTPEPTVPQASNYDSAIQEIRDYISTLQGRINTLQTANDDLQNRVKVLENTEYQIVKK